MPQERTVAIVTGAARPWGLGRAAALALARKGIAIAIADIRDDWGKKAAEAIARETGREALFVQTDVTSRASVEAMVKSVVSSWGRIDILANIAGIVARERVEEVKDETFDRLVNVNLRGTFLACQAVIPVMRRQRSGRIVNIASGAAVQPIKGLGVYAATKAGVNIFSKVLAWEVAPYGIIVTVVAPGRIITNMGQESGPEEEAFAAEVRGSPYMRAQRPEEVAGVVAFAATEPGIAMAGQTFHANGGSYMVF
ncbi:MAG: SDR family oxidoreductase [Chloroflexi bacterium]|nr:SDR family oxidoreductase [Chloroflexota bacterium]